MSSLPGAGHGAAGGHVFFAGDDRLEGMLEWPEGLEEAGHSSSGAGVVAGGVVVAHPHSLKGGTMAQPVVYRIAQACRQQRLATLRFNFRGVGGSKGAFSGTDEYRDVEAAAAFLRGRLASLEGDPAAGMCAPSLALAGYSFGSVMAAKAAAGPVPVKALALVGFVVSWGDLPLDTLTKLAGFRGPVLAVCAENDDLGYPEEVERVLRELEVDFKLSVIDGADHFFEGRQREVGERVAAFLAEALAVGSQKV
jgi:alpha/beta superfamily hydrolase